jgi:hypothetical protein
VNSGAASLPLPLPDALGDAVPDSVSDGDPLCVGVVEGRP